MVVTNLHEGDSNSIYPGDRKFSFKMQEVVGMCAEHKMPMYYRCMNHKTWLCGLCGVLQHKQCRTLVAEVALEEMKRKIFQNVEERLQLELSQKNNLEEIQKVFFKKRKNLKKKLQEIQLKEKYVELKSRERIIDVLKSLKRDLIGNCDILKSYEAFVLRSEESMELTDNDRRLKDFTRRIGRTTAFSLPRLSQFQLTKKEVISWCDRKPVFAMRRHHQTTQFARIQTRGDTVMIHQFQNKFPEGNPILVSFKELLLAFKETSHLPKRAFLQVLGSGLSLGEVFIMTDYPSPRAINFLLLCSGVKGRSYAGNQIKNCCNRGLIRIVPSEGTGTVARGITNGGVYQAPIEKGFVCGWHALLNENRPGFSIWVKDAPSDLLLGKFGVLEEGLEVCEYIYRGVSSNHEYFVKSCGLVI